MTSDNFLAALGQQIGKTQIPLNAVQVIQQAAGRQLTVQQLSQIMKQQQQQGIQGTIQQIIAHPSQPTIIATVTQSQPTTMVTKVLGSSVTPTSNIQTISAATPLTVTQVSAAHGAPTHLATLNVATSGGQAGLVKQATVTTETGATIQVHPLSTISQQTKLATIAQVTQPVQHIQVASTTPQTPTTTAAPPTLAVTLTPTQITPTTLTAQVTPTMPQVATPQPTVAATPSIQQQPPAVTAVVQAVQQQAAQQQVQQQAAQQQVQQQGRTRISPIGGSSAILVAV